MDQVVCTLKETTSPIDGEGGCSFVTPYKEKGNAERRMWELVEHARHLGYDIQFDSDSYFVLQDKKGNRIEYELRAAAI